MAQGRHHPRLRQRQQRPQLRHCAQPWRLRQRHRRRCHHQQGRPRHLQQQGPQQVRPHEARYLGSRPGRPLQLQDERHVVREPQWHKHGYAPRHGRHRAARVGQARHHVRRSLLAPDRDGRDQVAGQRPAHMWRPPGRQVPEQQLWLRPHEHPSRRREA
ncbi:hypothetical protein ACHHYP_05226 [Achlya hypogyna]|uniref:Uncharacterized protein n=1 Tax=Achlya hypogyna TaxID=1202772 RepID=A0A1V9YYI4_ACHHY|nr:hypothetical protein ACHHYP_05226 [Achlya hypogyna]